MSQQDIESNQAVEGFGDVHKTLAEKIARWTGESKKCVTPIPGLSFSRYEETTQPTSYLHEPSNCMVAQGAKRLFGAPPLRDIKQLRQAIV